MNSHVDAATGKWVHRFGASWLKTFNLCPQRALLEHQGLAENVESDAACVGTAMHLAAEVCISSGGLTLPDTVEIAQDEFSRLMALDGTNGDPEARHAEGTFRFVKYDEAKCRVLVERFTTLWWQQVLPTANLDAITEWGFTVPLIEDDERLIELTGTCDYVDVEAREVKDLKSSGGGPYVEWERRRNDVQASVYTYAFNHLYGAAPTFEFVVMYSPTPKHPIGVQRFFVERDQRHWNWLKTQSVEIARLIECDLPSWPRVDSSVLCSPKWCNSWDQCRGKDMGPNPW